MCVLSNITFIPLVFLTVCSYEELLYESGEEEGEEGEEEKTGKKVKSPSKMC